MEEFTKAFLAEAAMRNSLWGNEGRRLYRFPEEDINPQVIPTSLGAINTLSEFFDVCITEVRHNMHAENLDPLIIPDGVHKELNALVMAATLDINRVSVLGLSNLARKRPFQMDYTDRVMRVSIPLSFVDVKVFADYKINAGYVVISEGRIMGRIMEIMLYVTFAVDYAAKRMVFHEFDIPECDKIMVQFKGEGLSKYLLNVLTPIVITSFKTIVLDAVKTQVSKAIEDGLNDVNHIIAEMENRRHSVDLEEQAASSSKSNK